MNCVVTIEGNGVGRYGRFKADKTGPLKQFIVDNVFLYGKVFQHVKGCNVCNPVQILEHYLNRRRTDPKFDGVTTDTLVKLALKYEKFFKAKNLPYDVKMVNEFIWRSWQIEHIPVYASRLSLQEIVNHVRILKRRSPHQIQGQYFDAQYNMIFQILKNDDGLEMAEAQLQRLIEVASVVTA